MSARAEADQGRGQKDALAETTRATSAGAVRDEGAQMAGRFARAALQGSASFKLIRFPRASRE